MREIKFHKSEIITKTKGDGDCLQVNQSALQKADETEVRGRLRSRKDSISSGSLKPSKKGKGIGNEKKKKNEEKKETSEEEDGNDDEEEDGKPRKIKKKCEEQLNNEVRIKLLMD